MTNTNNMYCAHLYRLIAARDKWIKDFGIEQLKEDYACVQKALAEKKR